MRYLLRYLVYDNPSRATFQPFGNDLSTTEPPAFRYGEVITLQDPLTGLPCSFAVANIMKMKQIPDPDGAQNKALLFMVYLATAQQWPQFREPDIALITSRDVF